MDSRQHDSSSAFAIVSFTASLALHAGAVIGFAYVNPRSHASASGFASGANSVLVSLAPLPPSAPLPEPPKAIKPPEPEPLPDPKPLAQPLPEPPKVEEAVVRPGIDESVAETPNWLGFDQATPHSGVRSTVEQSALSPNPGMPLPLGVRAPQGEPVPAASPSPSASPESASTRRPEVAQAVSTPPVTEQAPTPSPDPASNSTQVAKAPRDETAKPKADGDAKPLAPDSAAPVGSERIEGATPNAPRESHGTSNPVSTVAATQAKRDEPASDAELAASKQVGHADGERGAKDDRTDEGASHRTDDARSIESLEQRTPRETQTPSDVMPRPEAPAEGHGPAPLAPTEGEVVKGDLEVAKPASALASAPASVAAAAPPATPAPANPGTTQPQGTTRSGTAPGEASDAESIAAALEEAIDVKPGKVLAAKGLQVQTVRPEWSVATRLMSSPRNPVVKVTFGRSGKVLKAEFVDGQTTGWPDVDGPLKDALYRWTAKGAALAKLPPAPAPGPDGRTPEQKGLSLVFRVILRNETPLER